MEILMIKENLKNSLINIYLYLFILNDLSFDFF